MGACDLKCQISGLTIPSEECYVVLAAKLNNSEQIKILTLPMLGLHDEYFNIKLKVKEEEYKALEKTFETDPNKFVSECFEPKVYDLNPKTKSAKTLANLLGSDHFEVGVMVFNKYIFDNLKDLNIDNYPTPEELNDISFIDLVSDKFFNFKSHLESINLSVIPFLTKELPIKEAAISFGREKNYIIEYYLNNKDEFKERFCQYRNIYSAMVSTFRLPMFQKTWFGYQNGNNKFLKTLSQLILDY